MPASQHALCQLPFSRNFQENGLQTDGKRFFLKEGVKSKVHTVFGLQVVPRWRLSSYKSLPEKTFGSVRKRVAFSASSSTIACRYDMRYLVALRKFCAFSKKKEKKKTKKLSHHSNCRTLRRSEAARPSLTKIWYGSWTASSTQNSRRIGRRSKSKPIGTTAKKWAMW